MREKAPFVLGAMEQRMTALGFGWADSAFPSRWIPLHQPPVPIFWRGCDAIEGYLGGVGRPPAALCACELRSPAQFTDAGFVAFNRHYVERLAACGIFRDEVNPVARSNFCPEIDPPATPSFYALSYTVPDKRHGPQLRRRRKRRGARWRPQL
jgi:hypothetical protein